MSFRGGFAKNLDMPHTADNKSLKGSPVKMFTTGIPEEDRADLTEIYGHLVAYMDKHVGALLRHPRKTRPDGKHADRIPHRPRRRVVGSRRVGGTGIRTTRSSKMSRSCSLGPVSSMRGRGISTPVRAVDILPTAIDLMGLPPVKHETEGRSFGYLLRGEEGEPLPPILHEAQLYGPGGDFALTKWPWRLLVQQPAPLGSGAPSAKPIPMDSSLRKSSCCSTSRTTRSS